VSHSSYNKTEKTIYLGEKPDLEIDYRIDDTILKVNISSWKVKDPYEKINIIGALKPASNRVQGHADFFRSLHLTLGYAPTLENLYITKRIISNLIERGESINDFIF